MRSRNSLMRERREAFRDARLIVIASEGKDTERIYFLTSSMRHPKQKSHLDGSKSDLIARCFSVRAFS